MVTARDLEGVWRLQGEDLVAADGTVRSIPADDRFGKLIYSNGHISTIVGPRERARLAEAKPRMDLDGYTVEERAQLAEDCVMYTGHYVVTDGVVEHRIEFSINPNRIGTTAKRTVELDGDNLTLIAPTTPEGMQQRIKWRRTRD